MLILKQSLAIATPVVGAFEQSFRIASSGVRPLKSSFVFSHFCLVCAEDSVNRVHPL